MNAFVLHICFLAGLVAAWLLIDGRLAELAYRTWGERRDSWLFLGAITDRRSLRIFYRWLGIVRLPVIIAVYIAALYHRVHR